MNTKTRALLERSFTTVEIPPFTRRIRPQDRLYFAGSCFASHLHRYWRSHFLPGQISPFGNIYNPESLKEAFALLLSKRDIREEELFLHQDLWRHSLFDTLNTSDDREALLSDLNSRLQHHREELKSCSRLVLTLGTAWVYRETDKGRTVNNCHKRPSSDFTRSCLKAEEITSALKSICDGMAAYAPGCRFILSLSPVRHLRDGAAENSYSKALLRCSLEELCREREDADYFPSFEIMTDELRDYRWYAEDLAHPSDQAVRYIMERFCEAAGSEELEKYLKKAEKLAARRNHRLRFPDTPEGRRFSDKLKKEESDFRKAYPYADFSG